LPSEGFAPSLALRRRAQIAHDPHACGVPVLGIPRASRLEVEPDAVTGRPAGLPVWDDPPEPVGPS